MTCEREKMPEWPEPIVYTLEASQAEKFGGEPKVSVVQLLHERARAEAALARLRMAVEALKYYATTHAVQSCVSHFTASETLAQIGEVPE